MASTKKATKAKTEKASSSKKPAPKRKVPQAYPPEVKARAIEIGLKEGAAKAAKATEVNPKTVESWLTAERKRLKAASGSITTATRKPPKKAAAPKATQGFSASAIASQIAARIRELEGSYRGYERRSRR